MNHPPSYTYLLQHANVRALGDGCPMAGTDVFVAMMAMLGDLAHPDSCLAVKGGQRLAIGMNYLIPSTFAADLVNQRVLHLVGALQNQHGRNTRSRAAQRVKEARGGRPPGAQLAECPTEATGEAASVPDTEHGMLDKAGSWVDSCTFSQVDAEHRTRPYFFFATQDVALLSRQLDRCHLSYPFAKIDVRNARDLSACLAIVAPLIGGVAGGDLSPEFVRGHVAITVDPAVFRDTLGDPEGHALYHPSLWLTGTNLHPAHSALLAAPDKAPSVEMLFLADLRKTIQRRLEDQPVVIAIDAATVEAAYNFVGELSVMDRELPGIATALRKLVPSLIFGYFWLYGSEVMPKDFAAELFVGLARALAKRMIGYRRAIENESLFARQQQIADALCHRLQDGPQTAGNLVRRFNRLPTADCRAALQALESTNRVKRNGELWLLVDAEVVPGPSRQLNPQP